MSSSSYTRDLIKSALRSSGWRRMRADDRPQNGQAVNVAQEWIERRHGTTTQFLVYCGEYLKDGDAIAIVDADDRTIEKPANAFHWWMPIFKPDEANVLSLHAVDTFRRMRAAALGYGGRL